MGIIIYNGRSSDEIPFVVERPPDYEYPERDYSVEHIPGRNGDLIYDNGAYKNVNRTYDIAVGVFDRDYTEVANALITWLTLPQGYCRLEDSYEPDYYRLAMYREKNLLSNLYAQAGRATISFECKPQRFLKAGEYPIQLTSSGRLLNPTGYLAAPLITVFGTGPGVLSIGGASVEIKALQDQITLDCDISDAYRQAGDAPRENKNSSIYAMEFPMLGTQETAISWTGSISKVEIIPRWWTI